MSKTYKDEPWGVQSRNRKVASVIRHRCGYTFMGTYVECTIGAPQSTLIYRYPPREAEPHDSIQYCPDCGPVPVAAYRFERRHSKKYNKAYNRKPERRNVRQQLRDDRRDFNYLNIEDIADDWDFDNQSFKSDSWFWL